MKKSRIVLIIVLVLLILYLSYKIVLEYNAYAYQEAIREVASTYNSEQKQCDIIGTTTNYIYVNRIDKDGEAVEGSKWQLTTFDGKEIATFETNSEGNGGLVGMDYGEYYISEIYAPENCEQDGKYKVDITAEDSSFTIRSSDQKYENTIVISVTDEAGNPVKDVEYSVYDINGKFYYDIKTDDEGYAGVRNLSEQAYYLVEKNNKESEKFYFSIEKGSYIQRFDLVYSKEEN